MTTTAALQSLLDTIRSRLESNQSVRVESLIGLNLDPAESLVYGLVESLKLQLKRAVATSLGKQETDINLAAVDPKTILVDGKDDF